MPLTIVIVVYGITDATV